MIDYGKVKSAVRPKDVEITSTNVFVASNIQTYREQFDERVIEGYEYDYKSYEKDEYIRLIGEQNFDLQEQVLETQMALCNIYESFGGDML